MKEQLWKQIRLLNHAKSRASEYETQVYDLTSKMDWTPIVSDLLLEEWRIIDCDMSLESNFLHYPHSSNSVFQGATEIRLERWGHHVVLQPNRCRAKMYPRNIMGTEFPITSPEELEAFYKALGELTHDAHDEVAIIIRLTHQEPELEGLLHTHFSDCWEKIMEEDSLICGDYTITMSQKKEG